MGEVSSGVRTQIKEFIRNVYVNWIKNGQFLKVLKIKTKNGIAKLHPGHIRDVLVLIFHKAKDGIISFAKKVLSAPMNFIRQFVSFLISDLVNSEALHKSK